MWFTNLEIRVKKYKKGYVIERRKGLRWVHIISVSGIESEPWYYKTKEMAISEAKKYLECDLLSNN